MRQETQGLNEQHPENRLVVYGSLAPGKPNQHVLASIDGAWSKGMVRGRLVQKGWGAALGFPAIVLDDHGDAVHVEIFESASLSSYWEILDRFEGAGYKRVPVIVTREKERLDAYIYVLA